MQKVYAMVVISIVATLGCTTAIAADLPARASFFASCCDDQSEVMGIECECSDMSDCGSACGECGCGICCKYRAHIASFGYFNCSCRGSYKFPVPPQYTYHWPGMYSQRSVTEYTSPYRFPPLEAPKFIPKEEAKITAKPVIQNTFTNLTAINPAKLAPLPAQLSGRPTAMSVRIKQKYGLK